MGLPKQANCNAHLERFFRSLKDEALSRIILFGETALRETVTEYLIHYHGERAHHGLDHQILQPGLEAARKREKLSAANGWAACSNIIIGKRPDCETACFRSPNLVIRCAGDPWAWLFASSPR